MAAFLIEHTIVYLAPILLAIVVGSFFLKPFLRGLEAGIRTKNIGVCHPRHNRRAWSLFRIYHPR